MTNAIALAVIATVVATIWFSNDYAETGWVRPVAMFVAYLGVVGVAAVVLGRVA